MKIVKPSFKLIVVGLVCFMSLGFIGTKVIGFINPAVADLDMNGYNVLMRAGGIGNDNPILTFAAGATGAITSVGDIVLPTGTAALPSIGWTDTGLYESAANKMGITFSGVLAHILDSDGLYGQGGNRAAIKLGTDATATLPTLIPNRSDSGSGIGLAAANQLSLIANSIEGIRITEAAGVVINSSFGNIAMGVNLIGFDGVANEGWGFDTSGNITFGSAGSYLDMNNKDIRLGTGGIGNNGSVLTFAIGASGKGTFAGAIDVTGDTTVTGHICNDAQQTITLGVGVTTFAVTRNVIQITGDGGGNVIATITGAQVGLYTFIFVDEFVTISNNDAHGASTVDLDGVADFGSADDTVLQLVFDGVSWYRVAESAN